MVNSPAVEALIAALESRVEHTPATLRQALSGPLSVSDVEPWIRFDQANYSRNLIRRGKGWELRLLCWESEQSTSVHGHGPSACCIRILQGAPTELVIGERDKTWAVGDIVEESMGLVHQVSNHGREPMLTLHAYSPEIPIDRPSSPHGKSVVIVGGGFAGVATAIHLLRRGPADLRLTLVERGPWLGRGIAFGVADPVFQLNVPASRMSLDPAKPNDFVEWASAASAPNAFLPRTRYGAYVEERLKDAVQHARAKLRVVRAEAVGLEGQAVRLGDGKLLEARQVVLATGLSTNTGTLGLPSSPRIIDAWDEGALPSLPKRGRLLLVGAGLSAMDVLGWLRERSFEGEVLVLSRRGLIPRVHDAAMTPAPLLTRAHLDGAPRSLRELIRWIRAVTDEHATRALPWQASIDSLRPHLPELWQSLPPEDRITFVRRVRPYWDALRHRAPPEALAAVEAWRAKGRLHVLSGRVASCVDGAAGLEVELRVRGGTTRHEHVDAIVRCTGPAIEDPARHEPMLRSLLDAHLAMRDPAGLGLVTDVTGAILGPDGRSSTWVRTLGAPRRASSWESTAVPEIAVQALQVAESVVATL